MTSGSINGNILGLNIEMCSVSIEANNLEHTGGGSIYSYLGSSSRFNVNFKESSIYNSTVSVATGIDGGTFSGGGAIYVYAQENNYEYTPDTYLSQIDFSHIEIMNCFAIAESTGISSTFGGGFIFVYSDKSHIKINFITVAIVNCGVNGNIRNGGGGAIFLYEDFGNEIILSEEGITYISVLFNKVLFKKCHVNSNNDESNVGVGGGVLYLASIHAYSSVGASFQDVNATSCFVSGGSTFSGGGYMYARADHATSKLFITTSNNIISDCIVDGYESGNSEEFVHRGGGAFYLRSQHGDVLFTFQNGDISRCSSYNQGRGCGGGSFFLLQNSFMEHSGSMTFKLVNSTVEDSSSIYNYTNETECTSTETFRGGGAMFAHSSGEFANMSIMVIDSSFYKCYVEDIGDITGGGTGFLLADFGASLIFDTTNVEVLHSFSEWNSCACSSSCMQGGGGFFCISDVHSVLDITLHSSRFENCIINRTSNENVESETLLFGAGLLVYGNLPSNLNLPSRSKLITITKSYFYSNAAFDGAGGALSLDGIILYCTDSIFTNNSAGNGGVLVIGSNSPAYYSFWNTYFSTNIALDEAFGSVILCEGVSEVFIDESCELFNNTFNEIACLSEYPSECFINAELALFYQCYYSDIPFENTIFVNSTSGVDSTYCGVCKEFACASIQFALILAQSNVHIAVSAGIYFGEYNTNLELFVPNVYMYSLHGANETILIGNSISRIIHIENALSKFTVEGFTFASGSTTSYGGAVYIGDGSTDIFFKNCMFENCTASTGGAFHIGMSSVTLNNCAILNNRADQNGGAIYLKTGGQLNLQDSRFSYNYALTGGGVVFLEGSLNVVSTYFEENVAEIGGVIHVESHADVNVQSSYFFSNFAYQYGGAIYGKGETIVSIAATSVFYNNDAYKGGALFFENGIFVNISTGIFSYNSAGAFGGVIYCASSVSHISDSSFTYNFVYSTDLNIDNNRGGVINAIGCNFDIYGSIFRGNSAQSGGAFSATSTNIVFTNSSFSYNIASWSGGSMFLIQSPNATITSCQFLNEMAADLAGCIYSVLSSLFVKDVDFVNNSAAGGGCIYSFDSQVVVTNSEFRLNIVTEVGGALGSVSSSLSIYSTVFEGNSANKGGAVISSGDEMVILRDVLFYDCHAQYGGALFIFKSPTQVHT